MCFVSLLHPEGLSQSKEQASPGQPHLWYLQPRPSWPQVEKWDFLSAEKKKAEASFTKKKKKNCSAEACTTFYLAVSSLIAQVKERHV